MRASGLTLIELVSTLAIAAIVTAVAVPSLSALLARQRIGADKDLLFQSLHAARATAAMRRRSVALCPGDSGGCAGHGRWEYGWLIFTDPNKDRTCVDANADSVCDLDNGVVLKTVSLRADRLTIRGNSHVSHGIRFDSRGYAGGTNGTFSVCPADDRVEPTGIVVANSGRIRTARPGDSVSCP